RRGADPRLRRQLGRAATRARPAAGHPEPQHRDGPEPVQGRPPAGQVPAEPQAAADRPPAGAGQQDRHDARPRRGRARGRRGARRPGQHRLRDPDARPVPAADAEAFAGQAVGPPGRVRDVEGPRRVPRPAARRERPARAEQLPRRAAGAGARGGV
ncbi:MAG: Lipoyl synthase, partial [uncultured Phycisphaerae bacterium]